MNQEVWSRTSISSGYALEWIHARQTDSSVARVSLEPDSQDAQPESTRFEIDLPAGGTQLVTQRFDKDDKAGGAYFTEVRRIGAQETETNNGP